MAQGPSDTILVAIRITLRIGGGLCSLSISISLCFCRMLYCLLMEAKLKFANTDCEGSVVCHEYLDRLKIIRLLLSNSCPFIPSIDELKMPAVRRCICSPYHYH